MRLGLAATLSHIDGLSRPGQADLLTMATAAERAGIDQLVLSEHVALARVITSHPGARPGDPPTVFPFPSDEEYPDPLVALAAIGAVTSRARLSTNILIAPLRPALLLAKMAATVDVLSGGRLDLGVGTGWHRDEFDAAGMPFDHLGRRLEDTIRACQALWRGGPSSFASATVSFEEMYCAPVPVQPGGVSVWFGGSASDRTARRVARIGHGWSVIGSTPPADVARGVELIRRECEAAGRDSSTIAIRCSLAAARDAGGHGDIERTVAAAAAFAEAGATIVQLPPLMQFVSRVDEVEDLLRSAVASLPR